MKHPIVRRVLATIRANALIREGDRVAVALSGGSDSVALTFVLRDLVEHPAMNFSIAGLVHLNHGLRGDEAKRDEQFCLALAGRLNLTIDVREVDVAAAARVSARSIETTARDLRDAFFTDAAERLGATVVATGHTMDDQAETVLLRLLRGASNRGLSGIRPKRGVVIRPLLDCRRTELRDYLASRGETFCEDSSNRDESIARNRVRHQLMPAIETIAPGGVRALARAAALAASDEAFLSAAAGREAADVIRNEPTCVSLDRARLSSLPLALARRVLRQALESIAPRAPFTARHLDMALDIAKTRNPRGAVDLPAVTIRRASDRLLLEPAPPERRDEARTAVQRHENRRILTVPGTIALDDLGRIITSAAADTLDGRKPSSGRGDEATVQAAAIQLPLTVRRWEPGDRLRPLGAPGRRKVQDLFVDRKVPRALRERTPIVVDAAGRIVWVVGLAIAHECRVTSPEDGMVILNVKTVEEE